MADNINEMANRMICADTDNSQEQRDETSEYVSMTDNDFKGVSTWKLIPAVGNAAQLVQ